ncbi:hypothetical protein KY316_01925 [Candidatus Woesearchaeota archaeon]|nr:hypothetical protein [Candidatus Woesearchaeota archaeon]
MVVCKICGAEVDVVCPECGGCRDCCVCESGSKCNACGKETDELCPECNCCSECCTCMDTGGDVDEE